MWKVSCGCLVASPVAGQTSFNQNENGARRRENYKSHFLWQHQLPVWHGNLPVSVSHDALPQLRPTPRDNCSRFDVACNAFSAVCHLIVTPLQSVSQPGQSCTQSVAGQREQEQEQAQRFTLPRNEVQFSVTPCRKSDFLSGTGRIILPWECQDSRGGNCQYQDQDQS